MLSLIRQYLWALDLVAVLLCAFFGAKLTSLYLAQKIEAPAAPASLPEVAAVQPEERKIPPFEEYQIILDRNMFSSQEEAGTSAAACGNGICDEGEDAETCPADCGAGAGVATGEPVPTSLSLEILGVLVVGQGDDPRSSASVKGPKGTGVSAVGERDIFAQDTRLIQVLPDRIIFLHKGRKEFALVAEEELSIFGPPPDTGETAALPPSLPEAEIPPPAGETVRKEGEGKFVIDQREVQSALANIERLYTEIRAVPNFAGGKVLGMKILSVKQGSLFDKLGLQRGDVLERINGMELDVKKGLEIFNQLKDQKNLVVDVVRQGQKKTFEYEVR